MTPVEWGAAITSAGHLMQRPGALGRTVPAATAAQLAAFDARVRLWPIATPPMDGAKAAAAVPAAAAPAAVVRGKDMDATPNPERSPSARHSLSERRSSAPQASLEKACDEAVAADNEW